MRIKFRNMVLAGLMALMLVCVMPAQATTIPVAGKVTVADPDPNATFGVAIGDAITGSTTFDESLVLSDPNAVITPSSDPTLMLDITIGDVTFRETDDFGFDSFPELTFTDGFLSNIFFSVIFDLFGTTVDPSGFTYGFELIDGAFSVLDLDTGGLLVAGSAAPVPEPATLLLLGSGLVGLAGWTRKSRMKQG